MDNIIIAAPAAVCLLMCLMYWWMGSSMRRSVEHGDKLKETVRKVFDGCGPTKDRVVRLGEMTLFLTSGIEATYRYKSWLCTLRLFLAMAAVIFMPQPKDWLNAFAMAYLVGAVIPAMMLWDFQSVLKYFTSCHRIAYAFRGAAGASVRILKGVQLSIYGEPECELLDRQLDQACLDCCEIAKRQGMAAQMNDAIKLRRSGDK